MASEARHCQHPLSINLDVDLQTGMKSERCVDIVKKAAYFESTYVV